MHIVCVHANSAEVLSLVTTVRDIRSSYLWLLYSFRFYREKKEYEPRVHPNSQQMMISYTFNRVVNDTRSSR